MTALSRRVFCLALAPGLIAACAPMVVSAPSQLDVSPASSAASLLVLARDVDFRLPTGYRRTLPAASRWRRAGRVPQGEVYRPVGLAFAIEGRQVHEAYLVVTGSTLRGFYLPAESAFSPLAADVQLPLGALP